MTSSPGFKYARRAAYIPNSFQPQKRQRNRGQSQTRPSEEARTSRLTFVGSGSNENLSLRVESLMSEVRELLGVVGGDSVSQTRSSSSRAEGRGGGREGKVSLVASPNRGRISETLRTRELTSSGWP